MSDRPLPPTELKTARFLSGYTARQVAEIIGRHPSTYCQIESGRIALPPRDAAKLSRLFQIPSSKLFTKDPD